MFKGVVIFVNNFNIVIKYFLELVFIFNVFLVYCGMNIIFIILILIIKDKISIINIFGFKKYLKFKIGFLVLFLINMKIGISIINVNKYG